MANRYGVDLSREHKTGCPRCIKNGADRSGNNLHVYGGGRELYFSSLVQAPQQEYTMGTQYK